MSKKGFWGDISERDLTYVLLYVVLVHVFFYKFLIPGQMVFGTDTMSQSYPMEVMGMREILANHSMPLWNPYMMSGMPLLASFSFHIIYPGNWLYFFLPVKFTMGYQYILHFCLMGIFFYYFAKHLGLSRRAAFIGGLLYVFNGHFITLVYPGHGSKIFTITYLPLALMFLDRALDSRPLFNFTLMGLMVGLMFYGGHVQILFYCGLTLLLFLVMRLGTGYKKGGAAWAVKGAAGFGMAFALGTLLYAVILLPAWQYKGFTQRAGGVTGASSYEFAISFSQPPEDALYLALRDPFGWGKDYGPNVPTTKGIFYRGRMGLKLSVDYFSIFGLVLACAGVLFVRNRYTWFFAGMALVTVFLSLGGFNPVYPLIYKYVPGFSIFRIPYAIMILFPICGSTLAAFGLQHLLDKGQDRRKKGLDYFIAAGAAVSLLVLAAALYLGRNPVASVEWLIGFGWVRDMLWGVYDDAIQRLGYFIKNLYVFVIFLSLAMLVLFVYRRGILRARYLAAAAGLIILVELWPVGWQFILTVPSSAVENVFFKDTPQIKTMEEDRSGPFRAFSLVTNNELLYRGIQSMTGYHAVTLGYYEEVISRMNFDGPILDMMNAKYLMLPKEPDYDFRNFPQPEIRKALMDKYELIMEDDTMFFYKNRTPMPRAWLVNKIWLTGSLEQERDIIPDPRFRPSEGALLEKDPESPVDPRADMSRQKVEVTRYEPDRVEFNVSSPGDSFMVVSEVWYPGWKAYVDGKEAKIYRTNYILRGLAMPAGGHKVVMVFTPWIFRLGALISVLALLSLGSILGWLVYKDKRKATSPPARR
jgi:hypothetical protein